MKLRFDPNQEYQLEAIASIVDVFEGIEQRGPSLSVVDEGQVQARLGEEGVDVSLGIGNPPLDWEALAPNVRAIQDRHGIEVEDPKASLEGWRIPDPVAPVPSNLFEKMREKDPGLQQHHLQRVRDCPHFTIEMETGTGKTYVYLRTMFELSKRYGFQKFIIVVPSVAIKEGVKHSIETMADHFRGLYDNHPFESFVYDAKTVNQLRQFATSKNMQVMVMNIQAFDKDQNIIYQEKEKNLGGRAPIEFVQAARPVVIVDEPQSVLGKEAGLKSKDEVATRVKRLQALNPLCTIRYSATHLERHNLMYRLGPIEAFERRLVKRIVVASAATENAANDAFVRVISIDHKPKIRARIEIHKQTKEGPKSTKVTIQPKPGQVIDLWELSGHRECYRHNFEVAEIQADPSNKYIQFSGGLTLTEGQEVGGMQPDVWRAQIKHTIKNHLAKELELKDRGIKVLSLFFIDKVANYREYDEDGNAVQGRLARMFEEEFDALAKEARFKGLPTVGTEVKKLHNGYFAQDKKGRFKESRGSGVAKDDESAYELIMKEKEKLLDPEEPLRFIFSHSALREGWDNPNVFQICTLNETRSTMKKRQEIGRGLRLPVDRDGERVMDDAVNRLYVMANESYEDFAKALQTEYEEDCGVVFGRLALKVLETMVRPGQEPERTLGTEQAREIQGTLRENGFLDDKGRILEAFQPEKPDFTLNLPDQYTDLEPLIIDAMAANRLQRHIQREKDSGPNRLRKHVILDVDFKALWDRIKHRTTYRVEFDTEDLVQRCSKAIADMAPIEKPTTVVQAHAVQVGSPGVGGDRISIAREVVDYGRRPVPDLLAYLQSETELTRGTLVRILVGSGRLAEVFHSPQRFMDETSRIIRTELHRTVVDGIKYEPLQVDGVQAEWEMRRFEEGDGEIVDYLAAVKTKRTPYEYTVFDSEVEKRFAEALDKREDIKYFVKLPGWFKVETPVGSYNPDWAIVKSDEKLYLVAETKGTNRMNLLKPSEQDKIRCGRAHFDAIDVRFEGPVTTDDELRWK